MNSKEEILELLTFVSMRISLRLLIHHKQFPSDDKAPVAEWEANTNYGTYNQALRTTHFTPIS